MCNDNRCILALDTCGAEATLALAQAEGAAITLRREARLAAKTAGSLLTGALRDLLGPIRPADLRAIVVVRGPGSFTGMRVGLSAAKALSEAAQVPLVAVSRLAVLAGANNARTVALDAGRGSVYLGQFADAHEDAELLTAAQAALHAPTGLFICEDKLQTLFPSARRVPEPTAWTALNHALSRIDSADWDDPATLDALYLWRADQMLGQPRAAPRPGSASS